MVAEFRASWDALGAAIEDAGGVGVPEVDPAIEDREGEAYERLKTVRPTTPEGFRALAGAWAMILGGERGGEPGLQHVDHAADSLIAGAGVCVPGVPTVPPARGANTIAGGLAHVDGTVTYLDAAGEAHRAPVAHWIGFVAMQLHCRAQIEMTRRREVYGDLLGAEIDRLEARSRRELRLDALSDLAFRPDRAFLAAEALRTGDTQDGGTAGNQCDHVHALIAEHRSAFAEWDRLSNVWNEMAPDDPGYVEAMAASEEPGKREAASYDALFSARPTTLAGAVDLASYLAEVVRRTRIDAEPTDGERALGTVAAALYGIAPGGAFSGNAPVTVSPAPADAALIALGTEFIAAWVEEARAGTSEAYAAVSAVAARIAAAPAETVAGYGIKALLVARLFGEGSSPLAPETVPPSGSVYSVWRMLRQVQEGAARLAGVGVAAPAADGEHDLAGLPLVQLVHLYEALEPFEDLIGRAENAACFWDRARTDRTTAGDIVYRESERIGRLTRAIAEEIERRQPADDAERDERLRILLRRAASLDGFTTDRALLTEALAACAS
ncbi:hypothetical protein [Methylobacterium sp. SI9]|uniref:hypothetical protein n=1 Tax=Methylobacterium guangdongense TaxID=3138811 RepID=UPI00313C6E4F